MAKKVKATSSKERSISGKRIREYLRQTKLKLSQEQKLQVEIKELNAEIQSLKDENPDNYLIKIHEHSLSMLNMKIAAVKKSRLEWENKFSSAVHHNNVLWGAAKADDKTDKSTESDNSVES